MTLTIMMALMIAWLAVALGLAAKSPETANSPTLLLQLLVFTSSAYVRPESMPGPLRWFAEHQPFTAIIEAMRSLLFGTPLGNSFLVAIAWCLGLTCLAYLWATAMLNREPDRI